MRSVFSGLLPFLVSSTVGSPCLEPVVGLRLLYYMEAVVLPKLSFRRSTSATFAESENGGRHQVPYECEYYEVIHVWHSTQQGAITARGL